jgi:hypothetical protein
MKRIRSPESSEHKIQKLNSENDKIIDFVPTPPKIVRQHGTLKNN